MGRLREFKRKLDEIQRRRSADPRAKASQEPARPPRWSPRLESVLTRASHLTPPARPAAPTLLDVACPGIVTDVTGAGRAWVMREADPGWQEHGAGLREALCTPGSPARDRMLAGSGLSDLRPEDILFLDIETTGLGSTPLFLIGTLALEESRLVARQYLARDYAEERAVLALFAESLRGRRLLVTFNGKSFDVPYVKVRLSYHRAPALPELPHFDVLLEARRIWRPQVPNCRLKTLEEVICGRLREGDIDGAQIPEAYHRYVRTGDAAELSRIVRHNRLDLLTMADLLLRMPPA